MCEPVKLGTIGVLAKGDTEYRNPTSVGFPGMLKCLQGALALAIGHDDDCGEMLAAIEQRLHRGQRMGAAGVEVGPASGAQFERPAEQAGLVFLVSASALHPDYMIIEGQHENA